MYCKKCGKLLDADDRFCSKCGARVEEEFVPAFKQQDEASGEIGDEKLRRQRTPERFNWDLDGYPTDQKKTEAIDFNWDSVLEEKQRNLFARELAQSELRAASDAEKTEEPPAEDAEATAEPESSGSAEAVEQDRLFAEMSASEAEEPTRVMDRGAGKAEGIDKFYTFNQKNAAFQALLDQEYERIQSGQDFVPSFIAEKEAEAAPEEPPKTERDSRHEEFDWTLPGDKAFSEAVKKEIEEPQLWWETDSKASEKEETQAPAEVSDQSLEESYIGVELARTPESYLALDQQQEIPQQAAGTGFAEAEKLPADEVPTLEELAQEEGEAAHGQFPPSRTAQKKAEEDKSRLTFYDVFGADDDDDASAEEPKKKGKALKIIAIFLCIFIVLDLAAIGILHFAPDSEAGKIIDKGYQRILGIFTGESQPEEPPQEPVEQLGETARLIEMKKSLGVNIATCEEDTTLLFEDGKDYGFEGFSNTYTFANKPWYTDDEGNSVTYGEEIIGTVIQFYSAWVDKINGKNDDILDFVDETSELYAEMQELQETEGVSYGINKLSIGDIRAGGAGFYVYVSVVKVDSDAGKEFTEKQILYMEPVNKTMQIVEIRTI